MRAAVMRDQKLFVEDIDAPEPGDGQVLVKTLACGICGSDLHALHHADQMSEMARRSGSDASAFDTSRNVVMGHEFSAEILDHGPNTEKTFKPGTRVCSFPITFSMTDGIRSIGYSNDVPGGYGEQMILNEMLLTEIPNGLASDVAALTEPSAVGEHAVVKANLTDEDVPIVIGCGPVGLAVIAALKARGVGPVIAADFSAARRKLAELMGADVVVNPKDHSPYDAWADKAIPEGYDPKSPLNMLGMGPQPKPCVLFECVGVPGVIHQMMEGAPRNARIVVVGVCMEKDHLEPLWGIMKEINMQFVLGYTPDEFKQSLFNIAEGHINVAPMITGTVGVSGIPQAFEDLSNPEQHAKIMVEPWRD